MYKQNYEEWWTQGCILSISNKEAKNNIGLQQGLKPLWTRSSLKIIFFLPQEYSLDLYFLQVWSDIRLAQGQDRNFAFSGNDIKKIWTPDTYFMNAKKTDIKNVRFYVHVSWRTFPMQKNHGLFSFILKSNSCLLQKHFIW